MNHATETLVEHMSLEKLSELAQEISKIFGVFYQKIVDFSSTDRYIEHIFQDTIIQNVG